MTAGVRATPSAADAVGPVARGAALPPSWLSSSGSGALPPQLRQPRRLTAIGSPLPASQVARQPSGAAAKWAARATHGDGDDGCGGCGYGGGGCGCGDCLG